MMRRYPAILLLAAGTRGCARMQEELGHRHTGSWYRDGNRAGLDRGD